MKLPAEKIKKKGKHEPASVEGGGALGRLRRYELTDADRDELAKLVEATPSLKRQLDLKAAYAPREGVWLEGVPISGRQNEPLVAFVSPASGLRRGSFIRWADDGTAACGFTLRTNRED